MYLVGMSEYIPYNLWLMVLLKEQGYEINDDVVFQENKSVIFMDKNGRNSCTVKSRHVNVRFFSVKYRIDKGEVIIEYFPTHLI